MLGDGSMDWILVWKGRDYLIGAVIIAIIIFAIHRFGGGLIPDLSHVH